VGGLTPKGFDAVVPPHSGEDRVDVVVREPQFQEERHLDECPKLIDECE
jgi:hypothetical protein